MNQIIKELLKEKGYTQQTLADKIGCARTSVYQTIYGNPSVSSLQRVADALGVPLWRLLATEEEVKQDLSAEPTRGSFHCPKCGAKMRIQIEISE